MHRYVSKFSGDATWTVSQRTGILVHQAFRGLINNMADNDDEVSGYVEFGSAPHGSRVRRQRTCHGGWATVAGLIVTLQLLILWQQTSAPAKDERRVASAVLQALTFVAVSEEPKIQGKVLHTPPPTTLSVNLEEPEIRGSTIMKPTKMLLGGLTPPVDQMNRGDCWLFALTGILEDSYRRFGVARGWLDPNTYLRLSRQAFGIDVMNVCHKHPSAMCPAKANADGEVNWGGTTDGADVLLLYYMKELAKLALPESVCPYTETAKGEAICDGQDEALATNPLRFNVTAVDVMYDYTDMQRKLIDKQRVITLGMPFITNEYYFPCTWATERNYRCHSNWTCVPCPRDRAFANVGCCISSWRPFVSMRGEWHHRKGGKMILIGGHAIDVVGYTDTYTDEWGNKGGLIVRNSWSDGLETAHGSSGRGSHSAAYYMYDVSDADEALVCPNPQSPRSWTNCKDLAECRSPVTQTQALMARSPLELRCIDNSAVVFHVCQKNQTYYMANLTEWDSDGLFIGCFIHSSGNYSLCAPPLLIDDLASVFTPVEILHYNDPDLCQFNFIPYATMEAIRTRFGSVVAADFEIEWSQSSYASQEGLADDTYTYSGVTGISNYSLIRENTHPMPNNYQRAGALWVN